MSDVFQQALSQALPLLQELKTGIKPAPKASRAALTRLRGAAKAAKSLSTIPAAECRAWTWEELEKAILTCQK